MTDERPEPTPAQRRGLRRLALDNTPAARSVPYLAGSGRTITAEEAERLAKALDNPPDEAELFRRIFGQELD